MLVHRIFPENYHKTKRNRNKEGNNKTSEQTNYLVARDMYPNTKIEIKIVLIDIYINVYRVI